ncbi:MAG: hypothetical protein DLM73_16815 [Chthoniobacterales bacterium]|nr:MAG: hypothetical protein DLM73_16815 [Chthoniobacterales bacterium]
MKEDAFLRGILSIHRGIDSESDDPCFAEAREKAESDPILGQWWAQEKELDRVIGSKLASVHLPAGLKARLISRPTLPARPRPAWTRAALLAAACLVALAVLFGSWRGPFQPAVSLADYRDEMVGFIKVDPNLEMKSPDLAQVTDWLQKNRAPSRLNLPKNLQGLEPIGCRTLRFRGRDVALICFKRKEGSLLHLFVIDRAALPEMAKSSGPEISREGNWMAAGWGDGDEFYLITVQGDRQAIEAYLSDT